MKALFNNVSEINIYWGGLKKQKLGVFGKRLIKLISLARETIKDKKAPIISELRSGTSLQMLQLLKKKLPII